MARYNKLVRDRIPEIIKNNGENPIVRILDDEEYKTCLERKLHEEILEFQESSEVEELADILEVIFALSKVQGISKDRLMEIYENKHNERGGFENKVFLVGTEEKNNKGLN